MVAVSGGLKASLVRGKATVDDNRPSLRHGSVTLQPIGTSPRNRRPTRLKAASQITGARLSLISVPVRVTA